MRLGHASAVFASDLLKALKRNDLLVRRRVAEALGNSGVPEIAPHLERLRFDADRQVANVAIKALNRLPRL